MKSDIKAWPLPTGTPLPLPKKIRRPCDAGLELAVMELEIQVGTIEAYNRLIEAATELNERIKNGDIKAQNPIYAKHIRGGNPD